jgi:Peptidase family C25
LKTATERWQHKPKYVLLVGDASVDPRNYLGFGSYDFVPTKIIVTSELKTASDDWFSDFKNTGLGQIPTGRLPARTTEEAKIMVAKILAYERDDDRRENDRGDWINQALLVADRNDTVDFTRDTNSVKALLPKGMKVTTVFASGLDAATARQEIMSGINSGKLLVNYLGHGSVEIWSGENLLDNAAASTLSNGKRLPVFLIMDCLNGFFHDVYTESLAESLLLSKNGGAVAVWASSGLTEPEPQAEMDQNLVRLLFTDTTLTLGDAIKNAKAKISDPDARRTYILFGDPLLRLRRLPGGARR